MSLVTRWYLWRARRRLGPGASDFDVAMLALGFSAARAFGRGTGVEFHSGPCPDDDEEARP